MATANKTAARKPAASNAVATVAKPATAPALPADVQRMAGAATADKPAAGWPDAGNGAAWLALLLGNMPATFLADVRAHKYGDGKGMLPVQNVRYTLSPIFGAQAAASGGKGKSGKYTVQALLCVAHKLAQAATGDAAPCGAAVAYFAYTETVLALLQPPHTKTAKYIGTPKPGCYNAPCPRWVSDYLRGNARAPALLFGVAG